MQFDSLFLLPTGLLLFVLLQTSLILYASAQNSTDSTNMTITPTMITLMNQTLNTTGVPSGDNINTTGKWSLEEFF